MSKVFHVTGERAGAFWAAVTPGSFVRGIDSAEAVEIIACQQLPGSDRYNVVFRRRDGQTGFFVGGEDTPGLSLVDPATRIRFDGDSDVLRLRFEAHRIRRAHLFDPMLAVHTSMVEPLPHQLTAVYEQLLPRRPLRFLLADDPGAGKTIMTGLFIRELIARGDLERCLIVAPGSLVEQWQDELESKFHLRFSILTSDQLEASGGARWFDEHPYAIARLDKLARDESLHERLSRVVPWDLIVVDEAHKMSASVFGTEVKRTKRYELGQRLASLTRHFLLLSATPHNGKDEDFALFLALLDPDRFEGVHRNPHTRLNATALTDIMRRLVKEDLLRFDGRRLFPERIATTIGFDLSALERELYDSVSDYVRDQFNRADRVEGRRRNNVGFALTILQRRLASSTAAIASSLTRRREHLERRLAEFGTTELLDVDLDDPDDLDDLTGAEQEGLTDRIVDEASAARTVEELAAEIAALRGLEALALRVQRDPESNSKWRNLAAILNGDLLTRGDWTRRKMVIFTEHRSTLDDLVRRIRDLRGRSEAVVAIHGGMRREQRRAAETAFREDPAVEVLVATDAAGEGINLQRAHLMANYDLPWNPNRIEQRFGRIHRIGQTEVCYLWNFVANGTREGDVFLTLFNKMQEQRDLLGDGIFDILGRFFVDRSLRSLLVDAIRHNDSPEARAHLTEQLDNLLDVERAKRLLEERALAADSMDLSMVRHVRAEMERAGARRLQPHFIRSFFADAFRRLGGAMHSVETERFAVSHVPAIIRTRARELFAAELPRRYERIAFDKNFVQGPPLAAFVCPGHPLLDAVVDLTIEGNGGPTEGAIFVDPTDDSTNVRELFAFEATVQDARSKRGGGNEVIARELCFVERLPDGRMRTAGPAPHLDYRAPAEQERTALAGLFGHPLPPGVEDDARAFTLDAILPAHRNELEARTEARVDKTLGEVRERLIGEITYHETRAVQLEDAARAGKQVRANVEREQQWAEELRERLGRREADLENQRRLTVLPPQLLGAALVVPAGYFLRADAAPDVLARARVERIAMQAVMDAERRLGFEPHDVSAENLGYDIESRGADDHLRFIEVKGRIEGAPTVTITRNEMLTSFNAPERYILALVIVSATGEADVRYVREPFADDPEYVNISFPIARLLTRAEIPS